MCKRDAGLLPGLGQSGEASLMAARAAAIRDQEIHGSRQLAQSHQSRLSHEAEIRSETMSGRTTCPTAREPKDVIVYTQDATRSSGPFTMK